MIRKFTWASLFLLGLGSCNSTPQPMVSSSLAHELTISGRAVFADGSGASAKNLQLILVAGGVNLFNTPVGSCPGDPHIQGTYETQVPTDDASAYSTQVPLSQFTSNANKQCSLKVALGQMDILKISASIDADAENCAAFCRANASNNSSCTDNCLNGNRRLTALRTFSKNELVELDRASQSGTALLSTNFVFTSLGPPIAATHGVDLVVNGAAAQSTAHVTTETFAPTDCAVVEGCLSGPGEKKLLRFDGSIQNLGDTDFVLGVPESNSSFSYSACHDHFHLQDIMLYELLTADTKQSVMVGGNKVVGRKQGFCMTDTNQIAGLSEGKFECEAQGITAGWEDVYDSGLDCQWIDVTGVPAGSYILRITVNPSGKYSEVDRSNNSADVPVTVP